MLSKIDELKLIARCVTIDDRRAFGKLVDAYNGELRRFLTGLSGGDECLADDLAQESFLKAYIGLKSFCGAARFKTWLFTIATREYYSWLRKRREEALDEVGCGSSGGLPDKELSSPHEAVEASHDVAVALASLSPEDRGIVLLFYMRDMSLKDVAKAVGLGVGTVKVRLHRARQHMAEFLKKDNQLI